MAFDILLRQMLGAVNEFIGAQLRDRLAHGRNKALQMISDDPLGPRSLAGEPKLGGPANSFDKDTKK